MNPARTRPTLALAVLLTAVALIAAPAISLADEGSGSSAPTASAPPSSAGSATAAPSVAPEATPITASSTVVAPAPATQDPESLAKDFYRGITTKNYFLAIGAALSFVILGVRYLLARKWKSFEQDRWGVALAAGMAGLTALAAAWVADAPIMTSHTWLGALKLFAAATTAYVTTKKLAGTATARAPSGTPA